MKFVFGLLAAALLASPALAQPPTPPVKPFTLKSDKEKFLPCRMLKVSAEGGGKNILWRVDGDVSDPEPDGRMFRCVPKPSAKPLTIRAYSAVGDEVSEAVLVIPPDTPTPIPPPPPDPQPTPPGPTDPLSAAVKEAVPAADRPLLKDLASLYRLMVDECPKAEYSTVGEINTVYHDAAGRLVGDKLMPARRLLAKEVEQVVPSDADASLTKPLRDTLAATYGRLAKVCDEAAK